MNPEQFDEQDFALELTAIIAENLDATYVKRYAETGMLTTDEGVLVRFQDGSEFQITIVQSSGGKDR